MEVARGEVNIRVNDRGLESELRSAEARFKASMSNIDRMKAEAEVGVDLKRLRKDLAEAEAQLKAFENRRAQAATTAERRSAGAFVGNQKKKIALLNAEIATNQKILDQKKSQATQDNLSYKTTAATTKLVNDKAKAHEKASKAVTSEAQQVARLRQQHIKLREEILRADQEIQKRFQSVRSRDRRIIDKERFLADLQEVERALAHLGGKAPEIDVKVDRHGKLADFFKSLSTLTVRVGPFTASLKQLGAAMLALGPIIIGLIGWLSALTGAIGAGLVGAAGVAGSALLGLGITGLGVGLIMKPMIKEISNARKASEALAQAESKYGKGSKEAAKAQEKLNQVLKGVSPEARKAIGNMGELGKEWKKLAVDKARPAVFEALGSGIKAAQKLLPMFARNSVAATKAASAGFQNFAAQMSSPKVSGAIDKLMQNTTKAIKPMMAGLSNLAAAALNIGASFSRFFEGGANSFEEWTNKLLDATNNTKSLDATVKGLMDKFAALRNFLKGAGRVLFEFFRAASGPGAKNLNDMGDALNKLADSMGSVEGQKKLKDFFSDSIGTAKKFYGAIKPLGKLFLEVTTMMRPMVDTALSLVGPLASLLETLMSFGPVKGIMQGLLTGFLVAGAAKRIMAMAAAFRALAAAMKGLTAAGALKKVGDWIMGAPIGGKYGPKGPQSPMPTPVPTPGGKAAGSKWGRMFKAGAIGALAVGGSMLLADELGKQIWGTPAKNAMKQGYSEMGSEGIAAMLKAAKDRMPAGGIGGMLNKVTFGDGALSQEYKNFDKMIENLGKTIEGRKFVMKIVTEGGPEAQMWLEKIAQSKLGQKLVEIISKGGPQAQAYLIRLAQTKIGQKLLNIISRGGPQAQAWLVRLANTKVGQKFMDIIQRGGPVAMMWLNRLAQTKVGQKLLSILSRGGPEAQGTLNKLAKTPLGRKILNIIDRGGPGAMATVNKLKNAQIRQKIVSIISKGGPNVQRQLERILGIKLPTKTQTLRERGGKLVEGIIGRINAKKLTDKSSTLTAVDKASAVANGVRAALATIPRLVNVFIQATRRGNFSGGVTRAATGGHFAAGGNFNPMEVAQAATRNPIGLSGRGGRYSQPTYMVGEERRPEVVIASNPAYRTQNLKYFAMAGKMLGVPGFAEGGPKWLSQMTGRGSEYLKVKGLIDQKQADYEYDERRFNIANRGKQALNPDGSINESFQKERAGQIKWLEKLKQDLVDLFERLAQAIKSIMDSIKSAMPREAAAVRKYRAQEKKYAEAEDRWGDKIKKIDALPAPKGSKKAKQKERDRRKKLKAEYRHKRDESKAAKIRAGKKKDQNQSYWNAENEAYPDLAEEYREAKQNKRTAGLDVTELQGALGEEFDAGIPPTAGQLALAKGESFLALAGLLTDPQAAYDLQLQGLAEQRRGYELELARGKGMLSDNTTANDLEGYQLITSSAQGLAGLNAQQAGLGGGSAFGTFNDARYDLYRQFGGNSLSARGYTPSSPNYGTEVGPGSGTGSYGGSTALQIGAAIGGAVAGKTLAGISGTGYRFGSGGDDSGANAFGGASGKVVNITNNYTEQPSDPHTWSKQMAWESNAAL